MPLLKATILGSICLQFLLWSQSRYTSLSHTSDLTPSHHLKRGLELELPLGNGTYSPLVGPAQCVPLTFPASEQCRHVKKHCHSEPTFLSISYIDSYFCAKPPVRPVVFGGLLVWLAFLFSFIGITASDFFCPNLSTIARVLGLSDNVAGVTFLAFGNGSPDLFATYSAMRTHSGSLAIGELLGAASFIVSVVAGSMCLVKPFKVHRGPFLRDAGFFTAAVVVLIVILYDSVIEFWEALVLIALYVAYVIVVIGGTWWWNRQELKHQREELMRSEYTPDPPRPYRDDPSLDDARVASPAFLAPPSPRRARALSHPGPLSRPGPTPYQPRSGAEQLSSSIQPLPSFSLLGALEFRDVVRSLQHESAASSLDIFENPVTPFAGGHYHQRHRSPSAYSRTRSGASDAGTDDDPHDTMPLDDRSHHHHHHHLSASLPALSPIRSKSSIPSMRIPVEITESPATTSPVTSPTATNNPEPIIRIRSRLMRIIIAIYRALFPTLHALGHKSWPGRIMAVFAAPAVLLLTLTLPVVVTPHHDPHSPEIPNVPEGQLVDLDLDVERSQESLIEEAEEEVGETFHELNFNKWLGAAQCALGPLFCCAVLFGHQKHAVWYLLATTIVGISAAVLVMVFASEGKNPFGRMLRCSMGFAVSMVWIMAIADEVVRVLQTMGYVFGLSDAIIGLTVFAVGNSIADFVADFTVAQYAPIMGFSACFGGPMLNILLGVGISGSIVIGQTGTGYPLKFSKTLQVSSTGLLILLVSTLVFVPWNGYFLSRRWGAALICFYVLLMVVNVVVEVKS